MGKLIGKYLNESAPKLQETAKKISEYFTMYIMGDRELALRKMNSIKTEVDKMMEIRNIAIGQDFHKTYQRDFGNLYSDIESAISNILK